MPRAEWSKPIIKMLEDAVANRSITREQLLDGMEDIADIAQGWADQMREDLGNE